MLIDGWICDRPGCGGRAGRHFQDGEQRGVIGTTAAILIAAGLGTAGAAYQSHAAGSAADQQIASGDRAAQLQYQATQDALKFAREQWASQQKNMAPWLQYGSGAVRTLGDLMGIQPDMSVGGAPPESGSPGGLPVSPIPTNRTMDTPGVTGVAGTAVPRPGAPPRPPSSNRGATTLGDVMGPPSGGAPPPAQATPPLTPPPTRRRSASQGQDMTRIRWADGTEQTVQSSQVARYVELGAEVVT